MPRKYSSMFTPEETEAYRARRTAEKEAAAEEALKEQNQRAAEIAKRRRDEREEVLHQRYMASGGTPMGWATDKSRLIRDAIAAPFSRRHF